MAGVMVRGWREMLKKSLRTSCRRSILTALAIGLITCVLTACMIPMAEMAQATHTSGQTATLTILSAPPHLVSGGDALIQVDVRSNSMLDRVQVTLNGENITAEFHPVEGMKRALRGVVTGLSAGEHLLAVTVLDLKQNPIPDSGAALTLTNWPMSGPMISGPHETPFLCQTHQFNIGPGLGPLGFPLDDNCSVTTRVDFFYRATDHSFKLLATPEALPQDMEQTTTTEGNTVPYVVRVETGTINRAIYQTAVLATTTDSTPDPWRSAPGWNGRLVYLFGGGCRSGWYRQGSSTGGVLNHMMLSQGFATASASLNVFGNNCNTLLAAESMMMVKERFIERHGIPHYTMGWGCSGGSYQIYYIADNYPGLLDGIIPQCSFPDVAFATGHVVTDAWLLEHYFNNRTALSWTPEAQRAVTGFGGVGHLSALSRQAARIDPLPGRLGRSSAEFNAVVPQSLRYDPVTHPTGARATIYDHLVAVYGRQPDTGFARRPLDNAGIQYGLQALNQGAISTEQFLDLNEKIGGFDINANIVQVRTVADPDATRRAYESGQLLSGGGGLASMPILDVDVLYTDLDESGDVHMKFQHFSTRERLRLANGRVDNHVMWSGAGSVTPGPAGISRLDLILRQALAQMDQWLDNIRRDTSDDPPIDKVVRNKPAELSDGCWSPDDDPSFIEEPQEFGGVGSSLCNDWYPAFSSPRMVAGGPLANDIVKCRLKPIDFDDYAITFDLEEEDRLRQIFPDGVCDWQQPGVKQRPLTGLWLSFGPSPVNRVAEEN